MAGGKVVTLAAAAEKAASGALRRRDPLSESRLDLNPIWVTTRIPEQAKTLFIELAPALRSAGFACDQDLQCEPHRSLQIMDYFQVYIHPKDAREPETVGMVTLYKDAQGNAVIKMNPECAGMADAYRKALSGALEQALTRIAGSGRQDFSATILQQPDFESL